MLVIVTGPAASGKSRHVEALAAHTNWQVFSIGEYRRSNRSWGDLVMDLRSTEGVAIVECVALPSPLRRLMQERPWFLIWVSCPEWERQRRLEERRSSGYRHRSDLTSRYDNGNHAVLTLSGTGVQEPSAYEKVAELAAKKLAESG